MDDEINNNKSFEVDWKFSAEDLIWNAEQVAGKLPLTYIGERQIRGEWFEVVEADGKEVLFKVDNSPNILEDIMMLINNHLIDKRFESYDTEGDSYGFTLVDGQTRITKRIIPEISRTTPAVSKYFILYRISSKNSTTSETVMLVLDDGRIFASKVNPGETLTDVVNREIVDLTGSNEYTLNSVSEHDEAKDRFGNMLRRYALYIDVPFFNLENRKTRYSMKWV